MDMRDSFVIRRKTVAIVPAYNEEANVGGVVREILSRAPFLDVVVVDDGSADRTAEEARLAGATVLENPRNLGVGGAVRTGIAYALEQGYERAVQVDADGQHDPSQVYRLLVPLQCGDVDVVVGSRFLEYGGYRPPWHRRLGVRLLASVVRAATGQRATDTTSGFRAMNRRAMDFLLANYAVDYPETESLVLMHLAGIRWREVPVTMRSRLSGESSIRSLSCVLFMVKVLARITLEALRIRTPRPAFLGRD